MVPIVKKTDHVRTGLSGDGKSHLFGATIHCRGASSPAIFYTYLFSSYIKAFSYCADKFIIQAR